MSLAQFQKCWPLIVSFFLTIALPFWIRDRTCKYAKDENVIVGDTREAVETRMKRLDFLLNWRDFIIAVLTGIFVIQFSAAEKIESTSHLIGILDIPLPKDVPLSVVATVVLWVVPGLILAGSFLPVVLTPRHVRPHRPLYWLLLIILLASSYFVSALLIYSPDK
jgi:hypothetical protein